MYPNASVNAYQNLTLVVKDYMRAYYIRSL